MRFVFSYTVNFFSSTAKKQFCVMLMMIVALLFLGGAIFLNDFSEDQAQELESLLSTDLGHTGLLYCRYEKGMPIKPQRLAQEITEIQLGIYEYSLIRDVKFEYPISWENATLLRMTQGMLDICPLDLSEGTIDLTTGEGEWPAYLGASYSGVPIGSRITLKDYYGKERNLVVKGILKSESRFIAEMGRFRDIDKTGTTVSLDDMFVTIPQDYEYRDINGTVSFAFSVDSDEVEKRIESAVQKLRERGINASASVFEEVFRVSDNDDKTVKKLLSRLSGLVLVVTVILMSCTETVLILNSRKHIGIWYACGAKRRQVVVVFALVFCSVLLLALGISMALSRAFINTIDAESRMAIAYSIGNAVYPKWLFVTVMVYLLGSAMPMYVLLRETPASMMHRTL